MTTISHKTVHTVPEARRAFKALFRADLRTQLRQRQTVVLTLLLPIIFIVPWRSVVEKVGIEAIVAICIAIALPAIGLMNYSQSVARDRELGVLERLRAAPVPTWVIMASRILVQVCMIVCVAIVTYVVALFVGKTLSFSLLHFLALLAVAIVCGLAFLGLGQLIVGLIRSSTAVAVAAQIVFLPLAIIGALGQMGIFGPTLTTIAKYSPIGTTGTLFIGALNFHAITLATLWALLVTLAYGFVFAAIGIKYFKWTS
jgi:ABC-2 type transport system permease protein